jgi:hypothetical protein
MSCGFWKPYSHALRATFQAQSASISSGAAFR